MSADFEPMAPAPRLPESPPPPLPESLRYPFWNYEDVTLFFAMGIPCLVLSVFFLEGLLWLLPFEPGRAIQVLTAQFIGYSLWFASLILLLRVRYQAPFWASLAWVVPKTGFWRSVLMGPMIAFGIAWLAILLRTPNIELPFREMLTGRPAFLLTGLFAVTIGPLCEELAFRGFLMPLLVRSFGVWLGILITALPFALLHGPQYSWSWRHLLLLLLAGIAFGRVRHATGSTAASAMTHATYNLTFFSALVMQGGNF